MTVHRGASIDASAIVVQSTTRTAMAKKCDSTSPLVTFRFAS
jgi:hypothetical protein